MISTHATTLEHLRQSALDRYRILDTAPERPYDDATFLATQVCDSPIALVSFVDEDREWFKSQIGIEPHELPRFASFCGQAIKADEVMIVTDALSDSRFRSNELVTNSPHVRFYAGAPLISSEGFALGTVCVMDTQPRKLSSQQVQALQAIARQVMTQLDLRMLINELQNDSYVMQRSQQLLKQQHQTLEAANAQLHQESITDPLTGLFNRRAFFNHLNRAVSDAMSRGAPLSLIMLDVDRFKSFNDDFGHPAGDETLRRVASLIQTSARKNDVVGRYGGEEFVVMCPGIAEQDACGLAERLIKAVAGYSWQKRQVTVSAGVAERSGSLSHELLIGWADQALYLAKSGGRNRVVSHSQLSAAARRIARK